MPIDGELFFLCGEGVYLVPSDGVRLIDAASGTFNLPLGYDHVEVVDAVVDQVKQFSYLRSSYSRTQSRRLLDRWAVVAPGRSSTGWLRDLTGSATNACAIETAQKASRKSSVLSLFLSHPGQTHLTTAISASASVCGSNHTINTNLCSTKLSDIVICHGTYLWIRYYICFYNVWPNSTQGLMAQAQRSEMR